MLEFENGNKSLKLTAPGLEILNWQAQLEADGQPFSLADAQLQIESSAPLRFTLLFTEAGLRWNFRSDTDKGTGRLTIESVLENISERPVRLGKVYPLFTDNPVKTGSTTELLAQMA